MSIESIKKAREGDEDAFQRLLKSMSKTINYYKRRAKVNGYTEQDIEQEIHMTIYKGVFLFDDERGKMGYRTFFEQLIARHLYNLIQRQHKKSVVPYEILTDYDKTFSRKDTGKEIRLSEIVEIEEQPFEYKDPSKQFHYKEDLRTLNEYINEYFSPLEKEIMEYMKKGYKPSEIEEMAGLDYKSIDNTKQRIRKKLNKYRSENE